MHSIKTKIVLMTAIMLLIVVSVSTVSAYVESDLNAGGSFIWGAFSRSIRESTLRSVIVFLFVGVIHESPGMVAVWWDLTKSGKSDILISETAGGVETPGALGAAVSFLQEKSEIALK